MSEFSEAKNLIFLGLKRIFKAIFRGWHLGKVVNFSNFFKIIFLYVFAIFWVIAFEFNYSKNFWHHLFNDKFTDRRISFYTTLDRPGERTAHDRMIMLLDRLGYDYSAIKFSEALSHFWLTAHFYYMSASIINYLLKPKFNLSLTHHVSILPFGYNIVYLNMPLDTFYDPSGKFFKQWEHLNKYDEYVDLYSLMHGKNDLLKNAIKANGKDKPIIPLYIAQDTRPYNKLQMDKALITGTLWGCNRNSIRFTRALKKLSEDHLLIGVGTKVYLGFLDDAYLGRMEDFGHAPDAIDTLQKKYGIALVVHSQEHMLDGVPTSRILEAVANGALVISDKNKFLLKFFGDSLLYFDIYGDSEEIYSQIKKHILWAKNNPAEAHAKTKKAYQIFIDNFTMEKALDQLFLTSKKPS